MSGDLFLFPIPEEPGVFDAARFRGGEVSFSRVSREAPVEAGVDRVVLIVPGEDVTLHRIETPARSDAQAIAAARFAIEDDLAEAIEDVEVLLGARVSGRIPGRLREAYVVSRARLTAWREELAAVGASADLIVPDYALLASGADELLAVDMGHRIVVRGEGVGFAADAALAPELLGAVLATRPGLAVRLRVARPDAILPRAAREGRRVEIEPAPSDAELIDLVRQGVADGAPVDLGQAGRKRSAGGAVPLKEWRLATGIAAAAAFAFFALLGAQTFFLRANAETANAQAEAALRAAFPDLAGDPRAALRALSAGGRGSASFLELSAVLAEGVAQVGAMQIESLRFDEADGRLQASVAYAAYGDVQQLRAAIEARGLTLTEGASRMQGSRMTGEIVVGPP